MFRQSRIGRLWNNLPLFWKTYVLSIILTASVVTVGEGAEDLTGKLISLADLQVKNNVHEAFHWLAAIIFSSLIGGWVISRIISGGLTRIQPAVERLSQGDLASRVGAAETERGDEIGGLGRSFNQMADNVLRLLENERTLIRDISHEMRSPLTRMKMALSLLKRDAESPEAACDHIRQLEKDIDRLETMVGQMLDQARLEAAKSGLEKTDFDLAGLLRESLEEQAAGAPGKNFISEGCQSAPYFGNRALVRRAIDNLIKNALGYTPAGSAVIVRLRSAADTLALDVIDHGPGVPEEKLDDIFRPFYRVDSARAGNSGGFGLGLAIARQAARLHGGELRAANISAGNPAMNGPNSDASQTGLKVTLTLPVSQNTAR